MCCCPNMAAQTLLTDSHIRVHRIHKPPHTQIHGQTRITHAHSLVTIHPSAYTCNQEKHTQMCFRLWLLTFRRTRTCTLPRTHTRVHRYKNMVTEARVCHTHIFASLSVVTLGTMCLAQRQAFREGM